MAANYKFKVNDRVKRTHVPGCNGTVKEIKVDVTATSAEAKEKGLMIGVLWDNGTHSFMGQNAISLLKE